MYSVVCIATCTESFVRFERREGKGGWNRWIPPEPITSLDECKSGCYGLWSCAGFGWNYTNTNDMPTCVVYVGFVGEIQDSPIYDLYVRETCPSVRRPHNLAGMYVFKPKLQYLYLLWICCIRRRLTTVWICELATQSRRSACVVRAVDSVSSICTTILYTGPHIFQWSKKTAHQPSIKFSAFVGTQMRT